MIDGVAFNAAKNRFLAAEGKSGNNIEYQQAERYGALDSAELVRMTGVTLTTAGAQTAEPVYVCLADNLERILAGLLGASRNYPVLAVGETEVTLRGGPPADAPIADRFAQPVAIPGPPPAIIRLDEQSGDDEFDKVVGSALVAEVTQGKDIIGEGRLASRSIAHLHLHGTGARSRLVKKVAASARRLCDASPENFEFKAATATRHYSVVKVVDNPEQADPRGRTQRFQALRARLEGREPGATIEEPTLFDEIDLAVELEKADTSEPDEDADEYREEAD